ncbi:MULTISPECIES: ATP-binding domain-containing protein [Sphingobium]|uniref:ATP-binding domain-containing protein n=1 Tax=Sphingobium TaxID=165695 RepID=UPI0015EC9407|nr:MULTISPECIES: ATP-binding domain-containing protein [Sphingobium]MCW2362458.1 superfamily I DNA and RNA helicase [Sphingobium sp. B10D3B]MCW2400862.1 superfamily I DNA and RNA helicase [Sphingobium sp. B10D7B]MCW2407841.1 superfamily I DNA and RNA helicase [Sphingobium xanthum]
MQASWWTDPKDLDPDQRKVVVLTTNKNHLVIGPPGCGKTNLLLLRATYLFRQGVTNIIVLSFGRVLREFLATGSAHYPFASDKVQTYVRWGAELLRANGIKFDESEDFDTTRVKLYDALLALADQGLRENVHDVILIDEAQDYSADEIALIARFGDRIFAVGDKDQRISDKTGALDKLVLLGTNREVLSTHYRNGLKVCRVADGVKNLIDDPAGLEATSNYDETRYPSTVDVFPGLTIEQQVAEAIPRIQTQLQAYPGEMIGIFCPRVGDLDAVRTMLEASPISHELHVQRAGAYSSFSPDRLVVLSTVMGAKGLEFRCVHMLASDKLKRFPSQRNLTYTAVTRTKTSLSIYHEDNLSGYFEKGLSACRSVKLAPPTLDELFL